MSLRNLRNLPSLADLQRTRRATPKGATRLAVKTADQRAKDKAEAAFRAAVWKRDGGKCRVCHRLCKRSLALTADRGEIHHLVPRSRSKADQTAVANGVLVCAECHGKLTRHEIEWKP